MSTSALRYYDERGLVNCPTDHPARECATMTAVLDGLIDGTTAEDDRIINGDNVLPTGDVAW
jgi:hypothetical protein